MQRQITISIPDTLKRSVEGMDDFESFVIKVINDSVDLIPKTFAKTSLTSTYCSRLLPIVSILTDISNIVLANVLINRVINALQKINPSKNSNTLEEAAELMRKEYASDVELTSFSVLDGESFYD